MMFLKEMRDFIDNETSIDVSLGAHSGEVAFRGSFLSVSWDTSQDITVSVC